MEAGGGCRADLARVTSLWLAGHRFWMRPAFFCLLDDVALWSGDRAAVVVRYRDDWFWIDDGDVRSKRALTAITFFFTLWESGGTENLPLVTIPAQ